MQQRLTNHTGPGFSDKGANTLTEIGCEAEATRTTDHKNSAAVSQHTSPGPILYTFRWPALSVAQRHISILAGQCNTLLRAFPDTGKPARLTLLLAFNNIKRLFIFLALAFLASSIGGGIAAAWNGGNYISVLIRWSLADYFGYRLCTPLILSLGNW
jgi:hypothetical protein